jgi:hypothetical protein
MISSFSVPVYTALTISTDGAEVVKQRNDVVKPPSATALAISRCKAGVTNSLQGAQFVTVQPDQ